MRTAILRATASRLMFPSACLWMLITGAQAADRPSPYLKGITTVKYFGVLENKGRCKVDRDAWNTAIEFVANQSTRLKLMKYDEHQVQLDEMIKSKDKTDQTMLKKDTWTDEDVRKSREAEAIIRKRIYAPSLFFSMTTIDVENGCAAVIEADVTATLKSSEMISTGTIIYNPSYSLWSQMWTLKNSYQSFERIAIETSERMMKSFVNDWAASQTLP
jgi:hypothetical protein